MREGRIERVVGSFITASGIKDVYVGEIVEVGNEGLVAEVIRLSQKDFTVQVYEPTSGLKPGENVVATGKRLVAELGPGLLTNVLDGVGRPLEPILKEKGAFVSRGIKLQPLPRDKKWVFKPTVKEGENVEEGDILGEVKETRMVTHKVLVPPGLSGKLAEISSGEFTVDEAVATVAAVGGKIGVKLAHEWPVRAPRPFRQRLAMGKPLITGQRVVDVCFPIAKGGTAAIPGGFGTGKTVIQHQLAQCADAESIDLCAFAD